MSPNSFAPYVRWQNATSAWRKMGSFDKQNAMIQKLKNMRLKATGWTTIIHKLLGLHRASNTIHSEYIVEGVCYSNKLTYFRPFLQILNIIMAGIFSWLAGRLEALQTISQLLKLDPTRAAAGITKLWITYYHTGIDDAIRFER